MITGLVERPGSFPPCSLPARKPVNSIAWADNKRVGNFRDAPLVTADREAIIALAVRGFAGQEEFIEAVVDTGFNGFLTLPSAMITNLGLPFVGVAPAELGDGSTVTTNVFEAKAIWDNGEQTVLVLGAEVGAQDDIYGIWGNGPAD